MKNLINKILKFSLVFPLIFLLNTNNAKAQESKKDSIDTRYVVVIDPGHGWENKEPGVMDLGDAVYKEYREVDIVLQQALLIKQMLDSTKYNVILTRYDNQTSMPLEKRQEIAKEAGADLFISLHIDNHYSSKARGFWVLYRQPECKEVALLAVNNLKKELNTRNRGIGKGKKIVLRDVSCPSILIESGFLKNYYDRKYLIDDDPNVERAIVATIEDYFESNPINPFPKFIKPRTTYQIPINYELKTSI